MGIVHMQNRPCVLEYIRKLFLFLYLNKIYTKKSNQIINFSKIYNFQRAIKDKFRKWIYRIVDKDLIFEAYML